MYSITSEGVTKIGSAVQPRPSGLLGWVSKKLCSDLIGHQIGVECPSQNPDFFKIIFAQREDVNRIGFLIDNIARLQDQLIDFVLIKIPQKNTFLDAIEPYVLTGLGDPISFFIIGNVINGPNRHDLSPFRLNP